MELDIRGKNIYGDAKTKHELIECLREEVKFIKALPDEAKIHNNGDDYITFTVEAMDKDDVKYYKSLGFVKRSYD